MKKKIICIMLGLVTITQLGASQVSADTAISLGRTAGIESRLSARTTITGKDIVNEAKKHLGKSYVWGATGPNTFDCSGLTQYVYKQFGIDITRTTYTQINQGKEVSQNNLAIGDLVFTSAGHVGIYVGNNQIIHAPQTGDVVKISNIWSFYSARRILKDSFDTSLWNNEIGIVDGSIIGLKDNAIQGLGSHSPRKPFPASWYFPTTFQVKYQAIHSGSHELAINDTWVPNNLVVGVNNTKISYPIPKDRAPIFSEKYYLANNPDVANAVSKGSFVSGYSHYLQYGKKEGRKALPDVPSGFNDTNYLKLNSDVKNAGYTSGLAHYLTYGYDENRKW